jgi:transcriptional regulator with GAF, ATPase, and Fis domain
VAINCGAIPAALIESELFGVRKGAFSGALADRAGKVASADGGTLFLDEIAELPESAQAALLRVLQDGEVVALGSARVAHVDVRIVAATHQDLPERVASGRFRNDLYARLRGHVLRLPPLRARIEDFGLLCNELLPRVTGERATGLVIQRAAARAMLSYAWPHNIRELERVLSRAAALAPDHEILLAHLPEDLTGRAASRPDERTRLVELLRFHAGNFSAVARAMATSRSQLRRLLVKHGLDLGSYRKATSGE